MIRGPGLSTTGGLAASSTWCCHASVNFLIYKVTREKNTVTIRNIERLVGGGGGGGSGGDSSKTDSDLT